MTVIACNVGLIPQMIAPGLSPKTSEAVIAASQLIANRFNLAPNGKAS